MRGNRVLRIVKFATFAIVFLVVFGFAVMWLWNWLMPSLFGLRQITYWQAWGILVLAKILFGGFHGRHGGHWQSRRRLMERWNEMTPEEREKFRQSVRGRCGFGEAAPEAKA